MKPLRWLPSAEQALTEIIDHVAVDNLEAALGLGELIFSAVESNLPSHPNMGRPGRVEGTRELIVHRNYIVIYKNTPDTLVILDVMHAARLYPSTF